jgi:hypothetical protein
MELNEAAARHGGCFAGGAPHWKVWVAEWGAVFGEPVVATVILDRLLHHSRVITIRGDSYRLRETRRAVPLQKAGATYETDETT